MYLSSNEIGRSHVKRPKNSRIAWSTFVQAGRCAGRIPKQSLRSRPSGLGYQIKASICIAQSITAKKSVLEFHGISASVKGRFQDSDTGSCQTANSPKQPTALRPQFGHRGAPSRRRKWTFEPVRLVSLADRRLHCGALGSVTQDVHDASADNEQGSGNLHKAEWLVSQQGGAADADDRLHLQQDAQSTCIDML